MVTTHGLVNPKESRRRAAQPNTFAVLFGQGSCFALHLDRDGLVLPDKLPSGVTPSPTQVKPRLPTTAEREHLIGYLEQTAYERDEATDLVERACIAVFDGYMTDCPGYCGRVMSVSHKMNTLVEVIERLARIENALTEIARQKAVKEWYSTAEAAEILGKAEFTVREHCRLGRIRASKRQCGRGNSQEWAISHEEIERIKNDGLLPDPNRYRHVR